jgi:ParB family chromosome partitioning protein
MNTTIVVSEANAVPRGGSPAQDIPLERIRESTTNPRRVFDETKLREFADNIRLHGVLQAILVRPAPDGGAGVYELVAGARRFRASKLAAKSTIPATVRDLSDSECREIQLIENLQREGVHELDEGIGYRSLMDLKPDFYTVETIAAQVSRSPSYVKGRISLTDLSSPSKLHSTTVNLRLPTRWKWLASNRRTRSVLSWNVFRAIALLVPF